MSWIRLTSAVVVPQRVRSASCMLSDCHIGACRIPSRSTQNCNLARVDAAATGLELNLRKVCLQGSLPLGTLAVLLALTAHGLLELLSTGHCMFGVACPREWSVPNTGSVLAFETYSARTVPTPNTLSCALLFCLPVTYAPASHQ